MKPANSHKNASTSSLDEAAEDEATTNSIITLGICLAWTVVSSLAILINKHILVEMEFPFPITITWLGLITTTISSLIGVKLILPVSERKGMRIGYYLTHVMPCGFFMAVAFLTGNLSFLYLTLSFMQMLKASTPIVTMLIIFLFKLETPSQRLITSVLVISIGVAVASYGEMHASALGLASMLTSVVAESTRLVMMQYLMDSSGGELHPMEVLLYISSACMIWLFAQSMVWEWGHMVERKAHLIIMQQPVPFIVAACAGFGVNALAIMVIKRASSLTLKVIGTAKDAALVGVGVLFLHESVTKLQMVGYSVSLAGFISYNLIKAAGGAANLPSCRQSS